MNHTAQLIYAFCTTASKTGKVHFNAMPPQIELLQNKAIYSILTQYLYEGF